MRLPFLNKIDRRSNEKGFSRYAILLWILFIVGTIGAYIMLDAIQDAMNMIWS